MHDRTPEFAEIVTTMVDRDAIDLLGRGRGDAQEFLRVTGFGLVRYRSVRWGTIAINTFWPGMTMDVAALRADGIGERFRVTFSEVVTQSDVPLFVVKKCL
jgi:hypothetical protein